MDNYSAVLIIRELISQPGLSQRLLSQRSGLSLGKVNKTVHQVLEAGLISQTAGKYFVNLEGERFLQPYAVKNAIIQAAGFGSRCVPLTYETPKGLLRINGRPIIEYQIEQLLEVGIRDITLVVGYMKERFEYLIDRYGVQLVYNPEYATRNTLVSILCVEEKLGGSYILCADHYMEKNIFHAYEPDSWYTCLYAEGNTEEWCVTEKNKGRIQALTIGGHDEWVLVGPAYFSPAFSASLRPLLHEYRDKPGAGDFYWEDVVKEHLDRLPLYMNCQSAHDVHEFESMEDLRRYDTSYLDDTNNYCMQVIARVFSVPQSEVTDFSPLKAGVSNKSFVFTVKGRQYVFRLPGEGSEKLIDRRSEKEAQETVAPLDITDELVYFDAESGIKISVFYPGARVAEALSLEDAKQAMEKLHLLHDAKLEISSPVSVQSMIERYETLAGDSVRFDPEDFKATQAKMRELLCAEAATGAEKVLCHGDFANTNVLFLPGGEIRLIDWEYARMGDPLMDVALYGIYSFMNRQQIDACLAFYCQGQPTQAETARCYLYAALCGYMWSMWSQYKQCLGEEFGEYPMKMYRYAKEFYRVLKQEKRLAL